MPCERKVRKRPTVPANAALRSVYADGVSRAVGRVRGPAEASRDVVVLAGAPAPHGAVRI